MDKKVLAFDFGASSGRAILGRYENGRILLDEIHRFSNDPVMIHGTLYWDFLRLYHEILQGINKAVVAGHGDFCSLGIDTWGVDFGLLDENGKLLQNVVHYRDNRTSGIPEKVFAQIGKEELYAKTGIQFMWFNTIFQLAALCERDPEVLKRAKTLLMVPDLLCYFLTGNKTNEYTEVSTSQLMDPATGDWNRELCEKLGIPTDILAPVVAPGTRKGVLSEEVCERTGCQPANVTAVASHDTGSACLAVPCTPGEKYAFISCGTWSLLGAELPQPLINEQTAIENYSNERGVNETSRFLKNIMGLWLMQQCRQKWNREGKNLSFADIDRYTVEAPSLVRFIDPDDELFINPSDMPAAIREFCRKTNQPIPENIGDYSRCITESLALKYRYTIEKLEQLLGYSLDVVRMVGGGVKDRLLCQFTANATGKTVQAGPIEATAIGNVCMQLIAEGVFANVEEARAAIAESFDILTYQPEERAKWDEAYERFRTVCNLK
ncbi:MAG: rhamnulokinase [Clostridia bacterium]|nr:rhamnulokinase [Clostridia bacterium]